MRYSDVPTWKNVQDILLYKLSKSENKIFRMIIFLYLKTCIQKCLQTCVHRKTTNQIINRGFTRENRNDKVTISHLLHTLLNFYRFM